jgi:ketosteroid isomerase-like protein
MQAPCGALCLVVLVSGVLGAQQVGNDESELRALPQTFSAAFNKHDGHALAAIMADDTRLLEGRFKDVTYTVLDTQVQSVRPEVAVVRHSWMIQGDTNADGSARSPRYGLMSMVADERDGVWVSAAAQNTNGPTEGSPPPEAHDIKSPIVVPRPK